MRRSMCSAVSASAFPLAYALSVLAGLATRLDDGQVALVWPAAAVAIAWVLTTRRRGRRCHMAHLGLIGLLTFSMYLVTGASLPLSAWSAVVNVVLAVVTVKVLAHGRTDVALRDPSDLARLILAISAGVCTASALATVYLAPLANASALQAFSLFAVRNGASALLGVALWLRLQNGTWTRPRLSPAAVAEALLVGAGMATLFAWTFWHNTGVPLAFLVLVPAVWVALRYSTTVSTVFLALSGMWITFATLSNQGALIVADPQQRALLAQGMVVSLTVIVLTLALYRDSRVHLIRQLETARDEAARETDLLEAVLDSIHDGVVLVDGYGEVVLQNSRAADSGVVGEILAATEDGMTSVDSSIRPLPRDVLVGAKDDRIVEVTTAPLVRQSDLTMTAFRDVTGERLNAQALREARDLFAGVLQAATEQAIIGTDSAGRITVFNVGAERMLGWTQAEMLGRTPMTFHHEPEILSRAEELGVSAGFEVLVHNVSPQAAEVRGWTYVRRDGTHAAVSLAVSRITGAAGHRGGYICVATDITDRRAAEQALVESERRFRLAFETAPVGMFMYNVAAQPTGRVTRCNQAMADLLGRSKAEVLTMRVADLGSEDAAATFSLTRLLTTEVGQPIEGEAAFRRADGAVVWGACSASVVTPHDADPYGICLVEDITARRLAEAELHHLALHDLLTGLANRALFMDRTEDALAETARGNSVGVGLIFLDLDGFKEINDTWGHAQGDEALEEVARRIRSSIRPGDTAARLGGDEFAVLCPGLVDRVQLERVAERVRAELARPVRLTVGGLCGKLSASVGVATSRAGGSAEALLQRADGLMYHAKRSGKNRVTIGDSNEDVNAFRAARLIPELDRAVDEDEFVVYFQPIVNLRTGRCVAAEALLRWAHPTLGLLAAEQFWHVLEVSRHLSVIALHVLNEACRQARTWTGPMGGAAVHVNVSGEQLEAGDFCGHVLEALNRTGLSADRLVLELTETYAGRVAESAIADLEGLREVGVRIAIDDVGTGFSGLMKILDIPVDILKIDKQFIARLTQDWKCQTITKAILSLGTSMKLSTIAEGIESPEQRNLLIEWGCELGQGFLFGRATALAPVGTGGGD